MSADQSEIQAHIRETVGQICAGFPGEYWREKDSARAYPLNLYGP